MIKTTFWERVIPTICVIVGWELGHWLMDMVLP